MSLKRSYAMSQTITINLSDTLYKQLKRAADLPLVQRSQRRFD